MVDKAVSTNDQGAATSSKVVPGAQKPQSTGNPTHPAQGIVSEIEAYFLRGEKLVAADITWLRTKLASLRAKL